MNHFWKKITALLAAGALALGLAGCGALSLSEEERTELEEEQPQVVVGQSIGQELQATYAADHIFSLNCVPDAGFNPYSTSSTWNKLVDMLVYETLVVLDESFTAQPGLVTNWETEDGRTWIFTVDTERTFHDGAALTALDAVYSLQMAMNYGGNYTTRFRHVNSAYTLDTSRFQVELSDVDYRFYQLMDIPCVSYGTGLQDRPAGTGAYAFSESGRYLTLFRDHPLAAQMPLDTIHLKEYSAAVDILQAFEDSYLDVVVNDPTGVSSLGYSSANIIKYVNTTSLHYLGYNMASRMFVQPVYRQMMTYLVDRSSIVSELMKGAATAVTVPVSPQSPLYPEALAQSLAYSPDSAADLLAKSGAADVDGDGVLELDGVPFTIDFIVCSDNGTKVAAARSVAKKLQDAGFAVNLRELGYDEFASALEKGEFDLYYAEVRLCADWDMTLLLGSWEELNFGGVRESVLDGQLKSFLSSPEESLPAAAAELYQTIGQSAYITPICFKKTEVLYHRGVITGLNPTQDNVFYGMENWTVDLG